jgi:hypothetical protein
MGDILTLSPTFTDYLQIPHRMVPKFAIVPEYQHFFWISDFFGIGGYDDTYVAPGM